MGTLPLSLMHFILNACFHIKIHAAISLLDFLSDLNDLEHDFVLPLVNGANLAFIDYSQSDHDEILLVRTGDSNKKFLLSIKYWEFGSRKYHALNLEVIPYKKTTALARSVLYQNAQNIFRKLAHNYPVKTYTEDVYESFVLDYRNT